VFVTYSSDVGDSCSISKKSFFGPKMLQKILWDFATSSDVHLIFKCKFYYLCLIPRPLSQSVFFIRTASEKSKKLEVNLTQGMSTQVKTWELTEAFLQ